jgi:Peptidase S24-like
MSLSDHKTVIDSALKSLIGEAPLRIRINGNCMAPSIRDGSVVEVEARKRYWPGDVLVLRSGADQLIAHRLIGGYRKDGMVKLMTQADNGGRPDGVIAADRIVGAVCGGDCAQKVIRVPAASRLLSLARFVRYFLYRLVWNKS